MYNELTWKPLKNTFLTPPFLLLFLRSLGCILGHYDQDPDENSNEIREEIQGMFYIVQVSKMGLLDNLLGVDHHVSKKYKQPKVELKLEDSCGATKDGRSKLQPEEDGNARREQASQVKVLPTPRQDGCC